MKQTLNLNQFCNEWNKWDDRKGSFSREGQKALFEYLENYEEETGEEIELDIVALCCEYTEYESLAELQKDYSNIKDMDDLANHTQVIPIKNSEAFIIQQF